MGHTQAIEAAVGEELDAWSVHEKVHVSYAELHDALLAIRRRLEGPRGVTTGEFPLLRFILGKGGLVGSMGGWVGGLYADLLVTARGTDAEAKEGEEALLGGGGLLYEMVNETWDALERSVSQGVGG